MSPLFGHIPEPTLAEVADDARTADRLSATQRRHLAECDRCARLLAGHRRAGRLLAAPWQMVPAAHLRAAGVPTGVRGRVAAGPRLRAGDGRPLLAWLPLALLLAAVALALIGMVGLAGGSWPRPAPALVPLPLPSDTDAWSRVTHPGDISAFAVGGPGVVAVGGGVWTSPDGRSWSHVADAGQDGEFVISDVAAGDSGFVAVGGAAVWTSADGATWVRAAPDQTFAGAWLQAITHSSAGFVAIGTTPDGPQAWTSADGETWERALVPPVPPTTILDGGRKSAYMDDVAAVGGRLVAVGEVGLSVSGKIGATLETEGGFPQMIIWTSTDGRTWAQEVLDPDVFPRGSNMRGLAMGHAGLVAVGSGPSPTDDLSTAETWDTQRVWITDDGLTWRRAPDDQPAFRSAAPSGFAWGGMRSVAAGPGGYVAVGGNGQCGGGPCPSAEAAIWTSPDGVTWHRVPTGPVFQTSPGRSGWVGAYVVSAWGSRFIVAGEWDGGRAVWISEPPNGSR